MLQVGPHHIEDPVLLAPMAGVTDRPFRALCRRLGAGMVVAEMLTADTRLWHTRKSRLRLCHADEPEPRTVQIAGGDPATLRDAAVQCERLGAQIIDINMGCPAKKVCNKAAGSALMRDTDLVREILVAVAGAVNVPVTLKIRTGWAPESRNAPEIARIAEDAGIAMLTVHGRTRACRFGGEAEYDTIARVRQAVAIPVIANGDIDSPEKARWVMDQTGVQGVMIGRAAQGRPWLPGQVAAYLRTGVRVPDPSASEIRDLLLQHVGALHGFYGFDAGVRIARKHVGWYLHNLPDGVIFRRQFNQLDSAGAQLDAIERYFWSFTDSRFTDSKERAA